MKRYDCTLSDKRGAFGDCMEAHSTGRYVLFSDVEKLQRRMQDLLDKSNRTGVAIERAISTGSVLTDHPLKSRLELLANHHKREQALADGMVDMADRCQLLAFLLREATEWMEDHPAMPDSSRMRAALASDPQGRPDTEWTDATPAPTEQDYRELQGQHDQLQSKHKGALDLLHELREGAEIHQHNCKVCKNEEGVNNWTGKLARIDAALAGKLPEQVCANGFHLLREANHRRQEEWDIGSEKVSLSFLGNELAGETGELCNVIKKLERERIGIVGSRSTIEKAATELADVVICADLVARALGINTWDAVCNKFNYTSAKYGLKTMLFGTPNLIQQAARTITPAQEDELVIVLQSIVGGFSDDPAHDAAALLKRITGEVPWTGDSFQIPPRQGGEQCDSASPSSSPA